MSRPRTSPRKFAEKIALLNKNEAESNADFEKIIKEVKESTRAPQTPPAIVYQHQHHQHARYPTANGSDAFMMRDYPTADYQQASSLTSNATDWQAQTTGPSQHQHYHHQQKQQQQHHGQPLEGHQILYNPPSIVHLAQQAPATDPIIQHHQPSNRIQNHPQLQPFASHNQAGLFQQTSNLPSPSGVPNIKIYSIDDANNLQQQVSGNSSVNGSQYFATSPNGCQTIMSSARSLPDIANLHVSCSSAPTTMAAAYSDQRIPTYDSSSNLLTTNSTSNPFFSNNLCRDTSNQAALTQQQLQQQSHPLHNNNQTFQHLNQPQQQQQDGNSPATVPWHNANNIEFDDHNNQENNNNNAILQQGQQICQKSHLQGSIVRASSFSTVSNGYYDTDTLSTPNDCNNLSRSSDGYYSFLENYNPSSDSPSPNYITDSNHLMSPNQTEIDNRIVQKSNSHSSIDNIILLADDLQQSQMYSHQTQTANQQLQQQQVCNNSPHQIYQDENSDSQFYGHQPSE